MFNEDYIDFDNFLIKFGFLSHVHIKSELVKHVGLKTFAEYYRCTGIHLCIVCTNLSFMKAEYFDYKSAPDMQVVDAVCMSISVPFVFEQPTHKGHLYTDGSICDNFPWYYFKNPNHNKIGVLMRSTTNYFEVSDILQYIERIISTLLYKDNIDLNGVLYIKINFPILKIYNLSDIEYLYSQGKRCAENWLKKIK